MSHTQYHLPPRPHSTIHSRCILTTGSPSRTTLWHVPHGVAELSLLPGWIEGKNPPSWYNDGGDTNTLLEDAKCLNWLSDMGGLEETFSPAAGEPAAVVSINNSGAGGS